MTQRTKEALDFGMRIGSSVKDIILKAKIYDDYLASCDIAPLIAIDP